MPHQDLPHIHFGNLIKRRLKTVGMSHEEFAVQMGKRPEQAPEYLSRQSYDVLELAKISRLLHFDPFKLLDSPGTGFPPVRHKKLFVLIEMEQDWAKDILEQHGV